MKSVVITGSSRGIGFGLADSFLNHNCSVVVSGKTSQSTDLAKQQLSSLYNLDRILAIPCDVRFSDQVQDLWDGAFSNFGKVDIWINNAGLSSDMGKLWHQSSESTRDLITTNILGAIYGSQTAMDGMINQGFGSIYNMEGAGSDGRIHPGMSIYGTTKYAVKYLTDSLAKEASGSNVIVGGIRPGMVITNLVSGRYDGKPEEWERVKRIFNIIAERVEVVTPWLVERILSNKKNGIRINYSSSLKILWRFISQPFTKRDIFND